MHWEPRHGYCALGVTLGDAEYTRGELFCLALLCETAAEMEKQIDTVEIVMAEEEG